MPRPLLITSRHTGWQLVYGLRTDLFPSGDEQQHALGCLDAPTAIPGGPLRLCPEYRSVICVSETAILRAGD